MVQAFGNNKRALGDWSSAWRMIAGSLDQLGQLKRRFSSEGRRLSVWTRQAPRNRKDRPLMARAARARRSIGHVARSVE